MHLSQSLLKTEVGTHALVPGAGRHPEGLEASRAHSRAHPSCTALPPEALPAPKPRVTSHQCRKSSWCHKGSACCHLCAFFVQAFWLRHSLVAVLFHLPASTTSFPHTPSLWTPPGASAFRVNTGGKRYETLLWQTTPPPSPTEGKRHAARSNVHTLASAGAKAALPCNLNTLPGMWKCPRSFSGVLLFYLKHSGLQRHFL